MHYKAYAAEAIKRCERDLLTEALEGSRQIMLRTDAVRTMQVFTRACAQRVIHAADACVCACVLAVQALLQLDQESFVQKQMEAALALGDHGRVTDCSVYLQTAMFQREGIQKFQHEVEIQQLSSGLAFGRRR